jgi:hypothetical protein
MVEENQVGRIGVDETDALLPGVRRPIDRDNVLVVFSRSAPAHAAVDEPLG